MRVVGIPDLEVFAYSEWRQVLEKMPRYMHVEGQDETIIWANVPESCLRDRDRCSSTGTTTPATKAQSQVQTMAVCFASSARGEVNTRNRPQEEHSRRGGDPSGGEVRESQHQHEDW